MNLRRIGVVNRNGQNLPISQGAGEEAVVAGVMHRAVQEPVETKDPMLLVELVLVGLVSGDLDFGVIRSGGAEPVGRSCQGWRPGVRVGRGGMAGPEIDGEEATIDAGILIVQP